MTRQNQNLNGLQGLALIIGMMACSSCATLKPEKIHYNDQALLYEYPVTNNQYIFLRMENGELVDNGNYESFIAELLSNKRRYPFDERMENAPVLSEKDYRAARLYAGTAESLNHEDYAAATQALDSLRKLLPGAMWYSDVAFLEGYAQEKAGDSLMAQLKYNEFIRFSSKKYSERFRGHKYADPNDSLWLSERRYALKFLGENVQALQPEGFPRIVPKYYFNSLQPGYTLNDESRVENSSGILLVGLNTIQSNDLSLGIQWYQHFYKNLDVSLGYFTAPGIRTANLALPIQVYRSQNNDLGIKFSPFIDFSDITQVNFNGIQWHMDENVLNPGFRISAGYYFRQRLSVGAWYSWFYYNKSHPYSALTQPLILWWNNQYDISLYYHISKGFSLKGGIQNGDAVAGIYWSGWEISYNITSPGIISRMNLY